MVESNAKWLNKRFACELQKEGEEAGTDANPPLPPPGSAYIHFTTMLKPRWLMWGHSKVRNRCVKGPFKIRD